MSENPTVTYACSEVAEPPFCNKAGMDALAAKDATIEDLSRKLEEARREATLHKEISDAREFELKQAEAGQLEKTGQYGETKSDQAYQVIGTLASLANCFEHPEVIRALDYFSSDHFDPEFLPFAVLEGKSND